MIIQEIISQLKKEVLLNKKSVQHAITASLEAQSRMEARYDSRKEDMARLAEAQDGIVLELEQLIKELKHSEQKLIPAEKYSFYLLVSKNGGKSFKTSVGKVTLVSVQSRLGSKLAKQSPLQ